MITKQEVLNIYNVRNGTEFTLETLATYLLEQTLKNEYKYYQAINASDIEIV